MVTVLGLAGLAGLASVTGCGHSDRKFDSEAYCQAIATPGIHLDAKALIDGDEEALADAQTLYQELKALAPPRLADEWSVILRELESMVAAAGGSMPVEDVDYQAFTEAFTRIEQDKRDRCEG
jgi:hypothetical protein